MRISDWSSDVCSSDLGLDDRGRHLPVLAAVRQPGGTIAVRQDEIEHDRVIDRAAQRAVRVRQARGDAAGKAPAHEPRDREIRKASLIFDQKDAHLNPAYHNAQTL